MAVSPKRVLQKGTGAFRCRWVAVFLFSLIFGGCSAPEDPAVIRRRFRENEEKLQGLAERVHQLEKRILALEATQYRPGFGELMDGIYQHHQRLWEAGSTGQWERASFELAEIREWLEELEKLYPRYPKLPKATEEMVKETLLGPLNSVELAVKEKNAVQFAAGYQELCGACTSCHGAAGLSYLVIAAPPTTPPGQERKLSPPKEEPVAPAIPVHPGEDAEEGRPGDP